MSCLTKIATISNYDQSHIETFYFDGRQVLISFNDGEIFPFIPAIMVPSAEKAIARLQSRWNARKNQADGFEFIPHVEQFWTMVEA